MSWPVERKYVDDAENKLAVQFPAAYISVMLTQNGGRIWLNGEWWDLHPFWDRSDRKRLARTSHDVVRETRRAREQESFPKEAVVIASNEREDHLLLMPLDDQPDLLGPVVYLWEAGGDGEPVKFLEHPFELWEQDTED